MFSVQVFTLYNLLQFCLFETNELQTWRIYRGFQLRKFCWHPLRLALNSKPTTLTEHCNQIVVQAFSIPKHYRISQLKNQKKRFIVRSKVSLELLIRQKCSKTVELHDFLFSNTYFAGKFYMILSWFLDFFRIQNLFQFCNWLNGNNFINLFAVFGYQDDWDNIQQHCFSPLRQAHSCTEVRNPHYHGSPRCNGVRPNRLWKDSSLFGTNSQPNVWKRPSSFQWK